MTGLEDEMLDSSFVASSRVRTQDNIPEGVPDIACPAAKAGLQDVASHLSRNLQKLPRSRPMLHARSYLFSPRFFFDRRSFAVMAAALLLIAWLSVANLRCVTS